MKKIKQREAILYAERGENRILWWEQKITPDNSDIRFIDDIPDNSPRWMIGAFNNQRQLLEAYQRLIDGGWEIITDNIADILHKIPK